MRKLLANEVTEINSVINISGQKYGRLLVVSFSHRNERNVAYWNCLCDCGNSYITRGSSLKSGVTKSCGCYNIECTKERTTKHGQSHRTREYTCWDNMKRRCYIKTNAGYKDYGARGIGVCDKWRNSFEEFFKDMGKMPSSKHTLERKRNDEDYSQSNCVWATTYEQSRNNRRNIWIDHNGEKMILTDWAKKLGVQFSTLKYQIKTKSPSLAIDYFINKNNEKNDWRKPIC